MTMHTLLQVLIGLTLVFVSAVGEVEAQAFLGGDPRRANDVVEQQIDALRARARCVEQHTTARTQVRTGHAGQLLSPEARAAREVQLADADHQFPFDEPPAMPGWLPEFDSSGKIRKPPAP